MKDSQFRILEHRIGPMEVFTRAEQLAPGYRPDFTARHEGQLRLIIENEPRTDLKAVIGSFQRAEKYCRDAGVSPSLVIVMAAKGRNGVRMATDHLREFATFWKSVNAPGGVREVLVLTDRTYQETTRRRVVVLSPEFRNLCQIVSFESPSALVPAAARPAPLTLRRLEPEPRTRAERGDGAALTA